MKTLNTDKMRYKIYVWQCLALLFLSFSFNSTLHSQIPDAEKDNIVFILVDDGRFDDYRITGAPSWFETPNIERIASEGANFTKAYAPTPLCGPSRASIYTGLYSYQHGAPNNGVMYDTSLVTIQEILKDDGYYTGFIGKYGAGFMAPTEFDYWVDIGDEEIYNATWFKVNGENVFIPGHITDAFNGYINAFFDSVQVHNDKPFALFFFQLAPHTPSTARPSEAHLYEGFSFPIPPNFTPFDSLYPEYYYEGTSVWAKDTAATKKFDIDRLECLAGVDDNVGEIFNYLDSENITDSTLIIYSSDNGYISGEHLMRAKVFPIEESIHVPLFIKYKPWFPEPIVIGNDMAELIDIPKSFLDLIGDEDDHGFEGISLRALSETDTLRKYARYCFQGSITATVNVPSMRGLRSFDYLYVHSSCECYSEEFYDFSVDPFQTSNKIFDVDYQQLIQSYRDILAAQMLAINDTAERLSSNCNLVNAFEIPDLKDNDCDGLIDDSIFLFTLYLDEDNDGFGDLADSIITYGYNSGYVVNSSDCDDANSSINVDAVEICDGIDNNCNGLVDDADPLVVGQITSYMDLDHDSYGNSFSTIVSCSIPSGFILIDGDCDDNNPFVTIGTTEICNYLDDDCDGLIDEGVETTYYADLDGDGFGDALNSILSCEIPDFYVIDNTDCNDNLLLYSDLDGDGYGSALPIACGVGNNLDCNNANFLIHPGAIDYCDGIDNNCNAIIDEDIINPILTAGGPTVFCTGSNVVFTASPIFPGYTYKWYRNGGIIAGVTGTTCTANSTGNYKVHFAAPAGCITISPEINVLVNKKPKPTITNSSISADLCVVNPVKLSTKSKTGYTYEWLKNNVAIAGATTNKYNATIAGNYKVRVVDANGCIGTSSGFTVTQLVCKESDIVGGNSPDIQIFPNPADNNVIIYFAGAENLNGEGNIRLINLLGENILEHICTVIDGKMQQEIIIPAKISSGIYIVEISVGINRWMQQLVIN